MDQWPGKMSLFSPLATRNLPLETQTRAISRSVLDNRRAAWFHERAEPGCALREAAEKLPPGSFLGMAVSGRLWVIMESLQGQLLIASPTLADPNFARTVVLVAVHGADGALGLILNRELNVRLEDIWGQVSKSPCLRSETVRQGGPVSGTLMALHDRRSMANLVVADEIYVATELSAMESLAASEEGRVVFFLGHAGWGATQLENELAEGSWLLLPATSDHVFGDLDTVALWKLAMTDAGRRQLHAIVPVKHVPDNPRAN